MLYDPHIFNYSLDGIDRDKYLIGTYYVEDTVPGEPDFIDHLDLVERMVVEGSTGTWVDVEEESPYVREKLSGKLLGYYEIPAPKGTRKAVVQLGFPIDAWEGNFPMMILSVAGNCFAFPDNIRLLDITFPEPLVRQYQGPKFGVPGIRERLGIPERPMSLHILKPKMGMTPEETARQVYKTAIGGVDMVKDDEMTSDVFNSKFDDRLEAVLDALKSAKKKTGKDVIYFCSVTDEVNKINEKARRAVKAGANGLLLCYSAGPSALRVLAEDPEVDVPILLHVSHMIALLPRISFVALAKVLRLCGADLMLTPTLWSSIPVASLEESLRTCQTLLSPFYHIKPAFPMPAAGMYPGLLPTLVQEHGNDIIIPAGGGMVGHPDGYTAGATAWQQAIAAVMEGIPLEEAGKTQPELQGAIDKWGIHERPKSTWTYLTPEFHPNNQGVRQRSERPKGAA